MSIKFYIPQKIITPPQKKNKFLATPLVYMLVYQQIVN